MSERSYGLRKIARRRPFIVPIFIPHSGCPHHCAFCNQTIISNVRCRQPKIDSVAEQINSFLKFKKAYHHPIQISFYGGNFLGLEKPYLLKLLEAAAGFVTSNTVESIRFSTRPDTITEHTLDIIEKYPVKTIEIGAQSMDDRVLFLSKRGHASKDTETAVDLLKEHAYDIGLQMMIGLPGEKDISGMKTARKLAKLAPDFVRIYPAIVLKNSLLEIWYNEGTYQPLSLDAAVGITKELYLYFIEKHIPVIRMGLQASHGLNTRDAVVAGPYHPAFGHLVHAKIFLDKTVGLLDNAALTRKSVTLYTHPNSISKLRGLKNANIKALLKRYDLKSIKVMPDMTLSADEVRAQAD
jgi:histone acetyltransferase (RNA polymerase elongator complex component)